MLFTAPFVDVAVFPVKSCGFPGGFYDSVQHIIDGFSGMKRIANMYPNTFYEGKNIQALTRKLGNLKYNQDTKEKNNVYF